MKDGPDTPVELRARALRLLARREHSRVELGRKLAPRAESQEALQTLLADLEARKQLSDERYASERARVLLRKYGSARIQQDLKAKGVDPDLVGHVSAEGELERATAILRRKYREPAVTREEKAKQARFLQSRGFSYDVIGKALKALAED